MKVLHFDKWYRSTKSDRYNGVDINGETSNILYIYSVTKDHSGKYECEVWNEYGCGCTSKTCALSEKH